ncbi:MAG: aldo/keto reductase [Verrucomicrobia bacterium]|nr:aldo/keto reductase [Verrucomicrobiota bacterium]
MTKIPHTDLNVFPLALGGNVFGWTANEEQSFAVLDAYAAAGGNFIDTADMYSCWAPGNSGGESETIIGRWMKARGNRNKMIIATKVGMLPRLLGLSTKTIQRAAEDSLERLQTDRIDLYYAHQDDRATPLVESLAAFDGLVRSGKVRYIAASNYNGQRLAEAIRASRREGFAQYVALQPHYNLMERAKYEGELLEAVAAAGLGSFPYFSLASGFLTGKYREGSKVDSKRAEGAGTYLNDKGRKVLAALDEIAKARKEAVASIALAWLAAQPTVVAPIASARTTEQLPALLRSAEVHLTNEEIQKLSAASE